MEPRLESRQWLDNLGAGQDLIGKVYHMELQECFTTREEPYVRTGDGSNRR